MFTINYFYVINAFIAFALQPPVCSNAIDVTTIKTTTTTTTTVSPTTVWQALLRAEATTTLAPPTPPPPSPPDKSRDIVIGPCVWAIGRKCPDGDIKFYLYTRRNPMDRQSLHIDETLAKSNLSESHFNPRHPTKIIIHGYNSDMFLHPLHVMREEYLAKDEYNMIYVDWSILSPGPCYMSAVHNTKHGGACVAQLVERILEMGSSDMHVVGFSLGAQLANYIARNLGTFLLPRITGLDPAMPLYITAGTNDKLDPSDAEYVDVLHTNALVQGKLERCGHVDFYLNGGIMQPGCYGQGSNPFACAHQRAPTYFLESIRSPKGFWGWACSSYIAYLLGMCPPTNYLVEAGENVKRSTRGMYFVRTNDTSPYALGKWTDLPTLGAKRRRRPTQQQHTTTRPTIVLHEPPQYRSDPLLRHIDQWGKLDSNFNDLPLPADVMEPTPFAQDPLSGDNWMYFSSAGTNDITQQHNGGDDSVEEQQLEFDWPPTHKDDNGGAGNPTRRGGVDWYEYRRNLTHGHIEKDVFTVPHVN